MLALGGVDASVLDETPIERVEQIASERVEAKQIENRVETTLPWKGQQGIKVVYDMGEPTLAERTKDKRDREVIAEPVTFMSEDGNPNGFKVDILLNERPDTNRFCYAIEGAENYDFFYQPEITDEEAEEQHHGKGDARTLEEIKRSMRPEDIVGSYAVYHKSLKDNDYKTGKVMHIPRPQVWSLSDETTKVWADLSYDAGELCVTVPQKFLDTAPYPVRVDPTFGYTSVGATVGRTIAENNIFLLRIRSYRAGTVATSTQAGTMTQLSVNLLTDAGITETIDIYTAVYTKDSGGSNVHGLLESSERTNLAITTSSAWYDFPLSSAITAVPYIVTALGNANEIVFGDGADNVLIPFDTGGTTYTSFTNGASGYTTQKGDPWSVSPTLTNLLSIYVTYSIPSSVTPQDTFWFD
jgi:hypothetical protein